MLNLHNIQRISLQKTIKSKLLVSGIASYNRDQKFWGTWTPIRVGLRHFHPIPPPPIQCCFGVEVRCYKGLAAFVVEMGIIVKTKIFFGRLTQDRSKSSIMTSSIIAMLISI